MKVTLLYLKLNGTLDSLIIDDHSLVPGANHFYVYEFLVNKKENLDIACVSQYDIETLEGVRILLGLPVVPTSAGRTVKYNSRKDVGGDDNSKHSYLFSCIDFIVKDATKEQLDRVYEYLVYRGYTGIGKYPDQRFHADRGYRSKLEIW